MNGLAGIYSISNMVNGKIYIGSSINLHKRKISHYNTLRTHKHRNNHLQFAFNKYGEGNLIFDLVEYCDKKQLLEYEQKWMDFIKPEYNIILMADRTEFTKEHREKLSKSHIGNRHTQESKDKIGRASKGNKFRLGVKLSDAHILAISNAKIGKRGRKGVDNPLHGRERPKDVMQRCVETRLKNKIEHPNCFCGNPFHAKGFCKVHYKKNYRKQKKQNEYSI